MATKKQVKFAKKLPSFPNTYTIHVKTYENEIPNVDISKFLGSNKEEVFNTLKKFVDKKFIESFFGEIDVEGKVIISPDYCDWAIEIVKDFPEKKEKILSFKV